MEEGDYKNLQSLIKKGEELAELRPLEPIGSHVAVAKAKDKEPSCYEWFLESKELIKKIVGEKTEYYEDFVSLSKSRTVTILPHDNYPNPGSEYGDFTYKFLQPEMKNQVAILKAIMNASQQSNAIDKNELSQRFNAMEFHSEIVRHGMQPFLESIKDPSKMSISVKECLTAYDVFIKKISQIDDTGAPLMGTAFSFKNDKTGRITEYPTVQVSSKLTSEDGRNFQNGIKFLSMGLMTSIRNLHLHTTARDDELDVVNALHIFSIISFIWKAVDHGIISSLAESSEFNESKQIAIVFERTRGYYKKINVSYPSVQDKNMLIKNCITNNNLISGYTCRPIICVFLKEEEEFIWKSNECTLSEEEKSTLKKVYNL